MFINWIEPQFTEAVEPFDLSSQKTDVLWSQMKNEQITKVMTTHDEENKNVSARYDSLILISIWIETESADSRRF